MAACRSLQWDQHLPATGQPQDSGDRAAASRKEKPSTGPQGVPALATDRAPLPVSPYPLPGGLGSPSSGKAQAHLLHPHSLHSGYSHGSVGHTQDQVTALLGHTRGGHSLARSHEGHGHGPDPHYPQSIRVTIQKAYSEKICPMYILRKHQTDFAPI